MELPSKKRKVEASIVGKENSSSFSHTLITAEELRKSLENPNVLVLIKDYFLQNKDENNVSNYIKAGGSISEISQLLNNIDDKKREKSCVIFSALQLIIIRTIPESTGSEQFENECKQLIVNYIGEFQSLLTSKSSFKHKRTVLLLLASVAANSSSLASLILSSLTLTKDDVDTLVEHFDPFDDQSLRTAFIHFVLSFVIEQNSAVVEKLLKKKFWIPSIFPGLKYDTCFTVKLFLSTLEVRIVDKSLLKTNKLYAFNTNSLIHLSGLYSWNPRAWFDISKKTSKFAGEINENDNAEIRDITHGILLKLCTSVKYGVVFNDPTYGTSGTPRNSTISGFLQKLWQPWEDNLKKDLLCKTLNVCPELLKPVLSTLQPRLKLILPNWLDILEFIIQILTNVKLSFTNEEGINLMTVVQELVVPAQLLDAINKGQLLKGKTILEKLTTIKLLCVLLNQFKDFSAHISKDDNNYYFFHKCSMEYLINNLPKCFDLLFSLQSSYENGQFEVVKEVINLITMYECICPEMVDNIRYNDRITHWVHESVSSYESSKLSDVSILLSMIRLEIIVNPRDIDQEHCFDLLKYTTLGEGDTVVKLGLDILKDILNKSGIFVRNENELPLWIYCMEKYYNTGIGSLISDSLKWALENKDNINMTFLEVQGYSAVEYSSTHKLDDLLKLSNTDVDNLNTSDEYGFNLSLLLPSILHILSGDICVENDEFIIAFIVHCFHQQVTIQPYIALLKKYNCPTVMKIMPYIESWLNRPVHIDVPPFDSTLYSVASQSVLKGKKIDYEMFKESIKDIKGTEFLLEECIFMACELATLRQLTSNRLEELCILTEICLSGTSLHIPLQYPALLSNFHPLLDVGPSNLTDLVIVIAEHCKSASKSLDPFSDRLAFELKYSKKEVSNLEDDSKLQKLIHIFKFSKSHVEDLIDYVFSLKTKYFEREGKLSPWSSMIIYLLTRAVELNITLSDNNLKNLINLLIKLIDRGHDTFDISDKTLNYFKSFTIDMGGELSDLLRELLVTMSLRNAWHKDLCIYIYHSFDKFDLATISIETTISLLASLKKIKKKHSDLIADSAHVIFTGLCENPSPVWLVDLKTVVDTLFPIETCKKICKLIKKNPDSIFTSIEGLLAIKRIFKKNDELNSLYSLIVCWLNTRFCRSEDSIDQSQSEEMCNILTEILESGIDLSGISAADKEFIMNLLLVALRLPSQSVLELLVCLVKTNISKLPPIEIFELLTSHSCFVDVMMNNKSPAKYSCLKLMQILTMKDHSLMTSQHVPILLSCYGASLSNSDQLTLKILDQYERVGGINLASLKPFVWGQSAQDQYSAGSSVKNAKPNPTITLDLLQKDMVAKTISDYPIDRKLNLEEYEQDEGILYDPAFYLPLLSQATSSKNLAWKLASSGGLALALASLSSSDSEIRSAAYHVLHRMYTNIQNHNDNLIWKHLIEALRGGIIDLNETGNVRLSSILTTFLARASLVMAFPDDPLYFSLHNFIFAKPHLKLNTVPAFFDMFRPSRGNQRLHQYWLMEVIKDGIKEQGDLQLALNSLTLKFILDYHSCFLASPKIKISIEGLVAKCIASVDKKHLLINNYSIIPWIKGSGSKIIDSMPKKINLRYKILTDYLKSKEISI